MKINIRHDDAVLEPEINIVCKNIDKQLEDIISYITLSQNTVTGNCGGEIFFIPLSDILYFETVDGRVFFYDESNTYETQIKLYQLEEKLTSTPFSRVSKSCIANLKKIRSIKREKHSKLCATLINGERVIVSRQYLPVILNKLGV